MGAPLRVISNVGVEDVGLVEGEGLGDFEVAVGVLEGEGGGSGEVAGGRGDVEAVVDRGGERRVVGVERERMAELLGGLMWTMSSGLPSLSLNCLRIQLVTWPPRLVKVMR